MEKFGEYNVADMVGAGPPAAVSWIDGGGLLEPLRVRVSDRDLLGRPP